jgi:hypothetical protein
MGRQLWPAEEAKGAAMMMDLSFIEPGMVANSIATATAEVRLQSQSAADSHLYAALLAATKNGVAAYVLLGPHASYEVIGDKVMIGKDPYPGAQNEFNALSKAGAEIFVNPRFSEVSGTRVQPGRESHASYLAVDSRVGMVCTGAFSKDAFSVQQNVCARTDNPAVVSALKALHKSEFDDTAPLSQREELERAAARSLAISPGVSDRLVALLSNARGEVIVRTAAIDDESAAYAAIAALGSRALVVLPRDATDNEAVRRLMQAGVRVKHSLETFDGTIILTDREGFVGSQRLTGESERNAREVGVFVQAAYFRKLAARIQR